MTDISLQAPATKNILLGITGGIAAYKSCHLVRLLRQAGHQVQVVMSQAATEFIHPNTFQALSGQPVMIGRHQEASGGMAHIDLTRHADVFLIAPATANTLAKIAHGIADNLITNLAAARNIPLWVAPAMNVMMWQNPANQRNLSQLAADGVRILAPETGVLACGEEGIGRMMAPESIADLLPDAWQAKTLAGKKVLITVGAGYEAIDPVRGITNLSSGRMGVALARAARAAGAEVSIVHSRLSVPLPAGMAKVMAAESAQQMHDAVHQHIQQQAPDIFIATAAVADYYVANAAHQKIKKDQGVPSLILAENPDILASVASLPKPPFCVGFAAESEQVLAYARRKKDKKNLPMIIANHVTTAMGQENNQVTIIDNNGETALPLLSKTATAEAMIQHIAQCLNATAF